MQHLAVIRDADGPQQSPEPLRVLRRSGPVLAHSQLREEACLPCYTLTLNEVEEAESW